MIEIKLCKVQEIPILVDVSRQTFTETFEDTNTAQDMQLYLANHFSAQELTKELCTPGCMFYVALVDGVCAAYMKLNLGETQTEKSYKNSLEIHRLYVLKAFKGRHVGSALMQRALEVARAQQVTYVWLGVWEHNMPAQAFYKKFGFVAFGTHEFVLGTDRQTDILMKRMM